MISNGTLQMDTAAQMIYDAYDDGAICRLFE